MTTTIASLVADNLDLWTSATQRKSGAGRGGGKRISLYGIERLRALILDLAVRGKLVPQDAGDEPARDLLKRLAVNKAALAPSRKTRPSNESFDSNSDAATTMAVPKGWEVVPLAQIASIIRGVTYGKSDASDVESSGFIALLRGHNIQSEINLDNLVYVPTTKVSNDKLLKFGDIVVAMSSGSADLVGKAAQFQFENTASFGAFCGVIRPVSEVIQPHLAFFCQTPFYRNQTQKGGKGIGIQNLSKGDLEKLVCPLPPLAEQRRIVAKVDELMVLCDALERESADAMAAHQALVEALLATLVSSADAAELATNWARLESHFDTLFTTEASIEALKQTILDLAVRGKLVEQDAGDEAVGELLNDIRADQMKRHKKKEIQKPKPVETDTLPPFTTPASWTTILLGDLSFVTKLAGFEYTKYLKLEDEGEIPVVRAQNVRPFILEKNNLRFISLDISEILFRSALDRPALLITFIGAGIGDVCTFKEDVRWHLAPNVAKAEPFGPTSLNYLNIFMNSPIGRAELFKHLKSTAQPSLSMGTIREVWVPLPPLAEQQRIVAKVDALMAHCDALKARITDAATTQKHLADAIVERAAA